MPDSLQTALAAHVETTLQTIAAMGGERLPERCVGRDLGPAADRPHSPERDHTVHCEQPARFELPYVREDGQQGTLTACAIDDLAGYWPVLASQGWL